MARIKQDPQANPAERRVVIPPLNMKRAIFHIRGDIMVQNAFSAKARQQMKGDQEAGHSKRKGKAKEPKDFQAMFEGSQHRSIEGWPGIPASAFRAGLISACRLVGFKMTLAKLSLFVVADGYDRADSTPLVRITKGEPKYREDLVRIQQTTDIHARAMFEPGWEAKVCIQWDDDQFKLEDVTNLLVRLGQQVGIGEGRPDSRTSAGMGWGTFEVLDKQ